MTTPYNAWLYPVLAKKCKANGITQKHLATLLQHKEETVKRHLHKTGLSMKDQQIIIDNLFPRENINTLFKLRRTK